ncbi:MAG: thioredoxin domain-containing protein, partial [Parachlamydiaceae bacterium]
KEEDRPIFLSIGYATCHWCHVMEKESFENNEIATLLNEAFINIKVDREELPEIDSLYMEFAQSLMSGSAGWPLNLILTPELKPFFAATYLPPYSKPGMIGLDQLIERIKEVWTSEEKEKVIDQAGRIVDLFSSQIHTQGDVLPGPEIVKYLAELLYKLADPVYGGLKGSPKFPIGYQQSFLLHNTSDSRSIFLAERTLDMMARGGIYDHIGGGFSRYSVDEEWFQPHFEKMLYDNALLMDAFLDAYLRTKKPLYKKIAKEIADYIVRDMTHPNGGYYSAEDADSEGEEGKFYTWTKEELVDVLGEKGADIFSAYFNVSSEGNFEGRNILQIKLREPEFAKKFQLEEKDVEDILAEERRLLMNVREKRVRPLKDDKILSSWNGLAIFSMASIGFTLQEDKYLNSARQAFQFIKKNLWIDGELYRRYREGADFKAGLDEYAFMIRAAIKLFECDMGSEYLRFALEMNHILESKFKIEGGAYFQTD